MKFFLVVVGSRIKRNFGICQFPKNEELEVAVREYLTSQTPHFYPIVKNNGCLEILPRWHRCINTL